MPPYEPPPIFPVPESPSASIFGLALPTSSQNSSNSATLSLPSPIGGHNINHFDAITSPATPTRVPPSSTSHIQGNKLVRTSSEPSVGEAKTPTQQGTKRKADELDENTRAEKRVKETEHIENAAESIPVDQGIAAAAQEPPKPAKLSKKRLGKQKAVDPILASSSDAPSAMGPPPSVSAKGRKKSSNPNPAKPGKPRKSRKKVDTSETNHSSIASAVSDAAARMDQVEPSAMARPSMRIASGLPPETSYLRVCNIANMEGKAGQVVCGRTLARWVTIALVSGCPLPGLLCITDENASEPNAFFTILVKGAATTVMRNLKHPVTVVLPPKGLIIMDEMRQAIYTGLLPRQSHISTQWATVPGLLDREALPGGQGSSYLPGNYQQQPQPASVYQESALACPLVPHSSFNLSHPTVPPLQPTYPAPSSSGSGHGEQYQQQFPYDDHQQSIPGDQGWYRQAENCAEPLEAEVARQASHPLALERYNGITPYQLAAVQGPPGDEMWTHQQVLNAVASETNFSLGIQVPAVLTSTNQVPGDQNLSYHGGQLAAEFQGALSGYQGCPGQPLPFAGFVQDAIFSSDPQVSTEQVEHTSGCISAYQELSQQLPFDSVAVEQTFASNPQVPTDITSAAHVTAELQGSLHADHDRSYEQPLEAAASEEDLLSGSQLYTQSQPVLTWGNEVDSDFQGAIFPGDGWYIDTTWGINASGDFQGAAFPDDGQQFEMRFNAANFQGAPAANLVQSQLVDDTIPPTLTFEEILHRQATGQLTSYLTRELPETISPNELFLRR